MSSIRYCFIKDDKTKTKTCKNFTDIPIEKQIIINYIDCSSRRITTLKSLKNYENLRVLMCINNNLITLEGIQECSELHSIDISMNCTLKGLNDLILFKHLPLTTIHCERCLLRNINGIEYCKHLIFFNCACNLIKSLGPLKNCRKLQSLDCAHNELTTLDVIENFPLLKILNASHNCLTSISSILSCPKLTETVLYSRTNEYDLFSSLIVADIHNNRSLVHYGHNLFIQFI